jgi:predicted nucleotidyltransferase
MDTLDMLISRRKEIALVLARYGVRNLRVFGSVARREDGPDSDIDFLVDLAEGMTIFGFESLQIELADMLGKPVDVGTVVRDEFKARMAADTVPIA